jgi:hypothetical protein
MPASEPPAVELSPHFARGWHQYAAIDYAMTALRTGASPRLMAQKKGATRPSLLSQAGSRGA